MNRSQLEIHPVAGRIGAEIVGVDLRADLDDETVAAIRSALLLWKVLFFRNQTLDADARKALLSKFDLNGLAKL